jgi:polyhydroxyalkanoate synthesis regulator phasin
MMENLSKTLADIALAGIGLGVIAVEETSKLVKVCADRGGDFLEKSRVVGEEWKIKAEQKAAEGRERVKQEYIERMTDEERADLIRRLAEIEARKAEDANVAQEVSNIIDLETGHSDQD